VSNVDGGAFVAPSATRKSSVSSVFSATENRQPPELEGAVQGQLRQDAQRFDHEVADVLKSLTFLAKSKSLSFREKRMLDRAKFLIISEVSEVMRETAAIEGAWIGRSSAASRSAATVAPAPRAKVSVAKAAPRAVAASAPARRAARAS
jgi:hypothetical protein